MHDDADALTQHQLGAAHVQLLGMPVAQPQHPGFEQTAAAMQAPQQQRQRCSFQHGIGRGVQQRLCVAPLAGFADRDIERLARALGRLLRALLQVDIARRHQDDGDAIDQQERSLRRLEQGCGVGARQIELLLDALLGPARALGRPDAEHRRAKGEDLAIENRHRGFGGRRRGHFGKASGPGRHADDQGQQREQVAHEAPPPDQSHSTSDTPKPILLCLKL